MKVWITGASSGIGEACAYEYAAQGACLVLTASSADRLQRVADGCMRIGAGGAVVLPFDLQDASGIDALCQQAWEAFSGLDILFCNAGVSQRTRIEDTSMETIRKIMEINFFAPVAIWWWTRCRPKNVFVCGDAANGASLVVRAMASGKQAAKDIDAFLKSR